MCILLCSHKKQALDTICAPTMRDLTAAEIKSLIKVLNAFFFFGDPSKSFEFNMKGVRHFSHEAVLPWVVLHCSSPGLKPGHRLHHQTLQTLPSHLRLHCCCYLSFLCHSWDNDNIMLKGQVSKGIYIIPKCLRNIYSFFYSIHVVICNANCGRLNFPGGNIKH